MMKILLENELFEDEIKNANKNGKGYFNIIRTKGNGFSPPV